MAAMSDQVLGTVLVVAASLTFACIALVVKVDPLPLLPATEARFAVCWVVSVLFMLRFRKERGLRWLGPPDLRRLLLLKAGLSFSWITLWWAALRRAPIGNCIAIIYCSPVLTSLWSRGILGEGLLRTFPLQVVLVLLGMLLVVDPPFLSGITAPAVSPIARSHGDYRLVFLGLCLCSLVPVVTRQTRMCSWIEVEHVTSVLASFVLNPCLMGTQYLLTRELPEVSGSAGKEAALIATAALGAFVAVAMETRGYQLAEPGKASMFRYVEVPFAYFLQLVGSRAPVRTQALAGSALILMSVAVGAIEQRRSKLAVVADAASEALLGNAEQASTTE